MTRDSPACQFTLPDELILMLLNEQTGYFYQVSGWELNCATIGAVLAELSLKKRIDMDMDSLFLLDRSETGDPILDPFLAQIADEPVQQSAQLWIERFAPKAEQLIDSILERLVRDEVLQYHDGDFWTMAPVKFQGDSSDNSLQHTAGDDIKARISGYIFSELIPDTRDIIIFCLANTCDVLRFMFELDDQAEKRIEAVCKMDLIGHFIAAAVRQNIASPRFRHTAFTRKIPVVSLRKMIFNPHLRKGNIPALFASLAEEYGPVFQLRPPFQKPMIFLVGAEINRWVHRNGRMYLRSRDYFTDIEKVYGASGLIPSLDGADHFRLRKAMQPGYSRKRLAEQLDALYARARSFMADWKVGTSHQAVGMCRLMVNAQASPIIIGIESQDVVEDLVAFKERALTTHVAGLLPKFLLHTPQMKRRSKAVNTVAQRVRNAHTAAQRAGCPRNLADDLLGLHACDPQFLPESNLSFSLSAPMLASMYLGDALAFSLYAMFSQPDLCARIQAEADALFDGGDPVEADFNNSATDVTQRFIMECLRMYPIVPMSLRNVMNPCVVANHQLPVGERIFIAQTSSHYMSDVFPRPYDFDIDRYQAPRNEHCSPGYAPYGLGTHRCLGFQWVELQLLVNLLLVAHHFQLEVMPTDFQLRFNPFPSMSPSKKLKFIIAGQRHDLPPHPHHHSPLEGESKKSSRR